MGAAASAPAPPSRSSPWQVPGMHTVKPEDAEEIAEALAYVRKALL